MYGRRPRTVRSLNWDCWTIWNRHTGEVVWRTLERNRYFAECRAMHKCLELNGSPDLSIEA